MAPTCARQMLLGHADISTTQIYTSARKRLAALHAAPSARLDARDDVPFIHTDPFILIRQTMSKARHVFENPTQLLSSTRCPTPNTPTTTWTISAGEASYLDPHAVVKTLVMEDESAKPLIVVMHGLFTKNPRARRNGVEPCKPSVRGTPAPYRHRPSAPARRCRWVEAEVDLPRGLYQRWTPGCYLDRH